MRATPKATEIIEKLSEFMSQAKGDDTPLPWTKSDASNPSFMIQASSAVEDEIKSSAVDAYKRYSELTKEE